MTNRRMLLWLLAVTTACSGTSGTSGGGTFAFDASGTDAELASQDVDGLASGTTDVTVPADVQDAKTVDTIPLKDTQTTASDCHECLSSDECATGWFCAQFQGSSYCAKDCSAATCTTGHACTASSSTAGDQLKVCVPSSQPCGGTVGNPDAVIADTSSAPDINSLTCGSLVGPAASSCCKCAGKSCAANGCYGGWFCNVPTCKCNPAPDPSTCPGNTPDAGNPDSGPSGTDASSGDTSSVQSIGPSGGKLASLDFAIVGDTRPPSKDDLSGYPTSVITQIFQDVQNEDPPLPFVVTTGDYQFSSPNTNAATAQLDLYLQARANYTGTVFYTLGNHECTGATNSNCGVGNTDGTTQTYKMFMQKMMAPLGVSQPWYVVNVAATDGSWTAKFVFVAANAWSNEQATWLDTAMATPTTYTFVVRHEGSIVTQTPGVSPSAAIIAKHPYTLLLVGHTHTFEYFASERQVVTGNGGAPLATGINYGYTVLRQRADKALVITAYDYATHATIQTFVVKPDGTPTK